MSSSASARPALMKKVTALACSQGQSRFPIGRPCQSSPVIATAGAPDRRQCCCYSASIRVSTALRINIRRHEPGSFSYPHVNRTRTLSCTDWRRPFPRIAMNGQGYVPHRYGPVMSTYMDISCGSLHYRTKCPMDMSDRNGGRFSR